MHTHTHTYARLRTNTMWQLMITIAMYDLRLKNSCTKNSCTKRRCFWGVSTNFWIRPATWLHFVHEIAVPNSRSPQHSWFKVLAETHPAQWVICKHLGPFWFLREMWFVDCSCKNINTLCSVVSDKYEGGGKGESTRTIMLTWSTVGWTWV